MNRLKVVVAVSWWAVGAFGPLGRGRGSRWRQPYGRKGPRQSPESRQRQDAADAAFYDGLLFSHYFLHREPADDHAVHRQAWPGDDEVDDGFDEDPFDDWDDW